MTWYVAAISKQSPNNWNLCKQVGLFGISTQGRKIGISEIKKNDQVLVWLGGRGFVATASIVSSPRQPKNRDETPWGGGIYRFGIVIPIVVTFEVKEPVWLGFENGRQILTGLSQFSLRKSFSVIPDEVALKALEIMKENLDGLKKK